MMRKLKTFLAPFSKVRRVTIVVFLTLLTLSSALKVIFIVLVLMNSPKLQGLPDSDLSIMLGALMVVWFISAMGFSISSNKALVEEKAMRRKEEEEYFYFCYEKRLAEEALKQDLKIIEAEENLK